jgi:D-alanyl-D-alanine carboxypeptidase/D-alanyl-D-alanine-endopeptidase (penicillin-binding protein 4)
MRLLCFLIGLGMLYFSHVVLAKHKPKITHYLPRFIYGTTQLTHELNRIIAANNVNATVGVHVRSMQYGDTLYARNIYHFLTPASSVKILTAEAALIYLGPEYRFSTQLLTDAKTVHNGILQGNLYVILSGDPSLTYYDLADLILALKTQEIQAIAGNVYIDNTAYDQAFYGPGWEAKDKSYCYAAPIGASIINRNCLSFKLAPARVPGHYAQVIPLPRYFYPAIKNSVITKTRARTCGVHLSTHPFNVLEMDGCMSKGRYAWGVSYVINDIPEYDRALFKNLLKQFSISVYGGVVFKKAPYNLAAIATHASKPLRLLINEMLKKSDNVIAGALFKKLGQLYSRQPGSWLNGRWAIADILSKEARVNTAGMQVLDGSGLSRGNLTTPAQMMQVLDFAYHHYPTNFEFISALPIAGVDGTLKHRLWHVARRVRAKTGTMSGVVSLAGYVVSSNKEPLAFVIMINGNKGYGWKFRALEDKLVSAIARYRRQ